MEKLQAELDLFSIEKVNVLHLTSFLLSVLLETIAMSQSVWRNFDSCKVCITGLSTSHIFKY